MKTLLDNSNIVESYPGVTLPLTATFARRAYHGVFKGLALRLTGNTRIVEQLDTKLKDMVVNHRGHMYYDLNNWYAVIGLLPFHRRVAKIWRQMLGVSDDDIPQSTVRPSSLQTLRIVNNTRKIAHYLPKEMNALDKKFTQYMKEFYEKDITELSHKELTDLYRELENNLMSIWDITLANDMYAFVYSWLVERRTSNAKMYLANLSHVESMRPLKELLKLTQLAKKTDYLEKLNQLTDGNTVPRSKNDVFSRSFNNFISLYGDRYLEELKLESSTYRTDPALLARTILSYVSNVDDTINNLGTITSDKPKLGFVSKRYFERASVGIKNREVSRLNRSRLYGMVREIMLQIGSKLAEQGVIENANDIFYMTLDEALDTSLTSAIRNSISERKKQYAEYRKLSLPGRIVLDGKTDITESVTAQTDDVPLAGIPVSSGIVEGELLVIENPETTLETTGKILVTKTTDPGWVFLLVQSKGIIAEKGSLLSHTAILSRELSIPAVVGVQNATKRLRSGQHVRLDGNTGNIEVLDV